MKHLIQKLDNKQHEKAVFIYVRNWLSLGFQDKITEVKVLLKLGFRDLDQTFRIELVTLGFKAIEIMSLLADLELEIVDVLHIVLSQPFPLLRCFRRTALLSLNLPLALLHIS